jgi:hypothetical protein
MQQRPTDTLTGRHTHTEARGPPRALLTQSMR